MTTRLDGKAVVITGAGAGLGHSYAMASARAGAAVVVNDVNADAAEAAARTIRQEGGTAVAVAGSVASWEDAQRTVDTCIAEYGRIDGYVANAAIMHMVEPWEESEEHLRVIVDVNVLGVQFGVRHAMRAMLDTGHGGSIVTIVSGAQFGMRGMSAYGATKGAVNAMTVNWALEGADKGIRVNAVSPIGRTKMTLDHTQDDPLSFAPPETIAPVVVSLLSDSTSDITGRVIRFDGQLLSVYETERTPIEQRPHWSADDITTSLHKQFGSAT